MTDLTSNSLLALVDDIRDCKLCESNLPLGARPIVQAQQDARILIIGQAPGSKVHASGVPWDDASGDRLRQWLDIDKATFYGPLVAIMPMGFCYPGRGKSGDLPPRKECAELWHERLLAKLSNTQLTVLIGQYAQQAYLPSSEKTLTANVRNFNNFLPDYLALPHPSPRNNIWLKKNPWFEAELVPAVQRVIADVVN